MLLIIFILFIIIFILKYFISNMNNYFFDYAEKEVYKTTKDIIDNSKVSLNYDIEKLYTIIHDDSFIVDYNNKILSKYSNAIGSNIKKEYKRLEKKGLVIKIPLSSVFKNPLIYFKSPMIPVKIKLIGNVSSDIKIEIKEYGINSSLIVVKNQVVITERIVLPMIYKDIKVKNDIPIMYKIINSKVPEYYADVE